MGADGSGKVNITDNDGPSESEPHWSPDGSRIAVLSDSEEREGPGDVFVMNADGSGAAKVLDREVKGGDLDWGPAPARIVPRKLTAAVKATGPRALDQRALGACGRERSMFRPRAPEGREGCEDARHANGLPRHQLPLQDHSAPARRHEGQGEGLGGLPRHARHRAEARDARPSAVALTSDQRTTRRSDEPAAAEMGALERSLVGRPDPWRTRREEVACSGPHRPFVVASGGAHRPVRRCRGPRPRRRVRQRAADRRPVRRRGRRGAQLDPDRHQARSPGHRADDASRARHLRRTGDSRPRQWLREGRRSRPGHDLRGVPGDGRRRSTSCSAWATTTASESPANCRIGVASTAAPGRKTSPAAGA